MIIIRVITNIIVIFCIFSSASITIIIASQFNILIRIFNFVNELIYNYNLEKRNHYIKTFYAMVKNSYIYIFNHDLNKIQQK